MRVYLKIFFISLLFVIPLKASANCQDMKILIDAAQIAVSEYETSTPEDDCLMCGYLLVGEEDPNLEKSNFKGNDLWKVPVFGDGEGCYGDVFLTVKANTCSIVEKPSFDGVTCTDE